MQVREALRFFFFFFFFFFFSFYLDYSVEELTRDTILGIENSFSSIL